MLNFVEMAPSQSVKMSSGGIFRQGLEAVDLVFIPCQRVIMRRRRPRDALP